MIPASDEAGVPQQGGIFRDQFRSHVGPSGFPRDVERLAKLVTDDLSRPRPRNFANEVDAARHLVGRQVSPAVFEDGLALDLRTPSPGDHEQRRHLAKMRVRNPDDGAIHNALERVHDFLYFRRSNVLAAANDQFLQPSGDGQKVVAIALGEIAGIRRTRFRSGERRDVVLHNIFGCYEGCGGCRPRRRGRVHRQW